MIVICRGIKAQIGRLGAFAKSSLVCCGLGRNRVRLPRGAPGCAPGGPWRALGFRGDWVGDSY